MDLVTPMINLPHYWGKLSHFTNIFWRTFQKKLLRMRRWAMCGDKDKYSYYINYNGPEASSTSLILFPEPNVWKMAQFTPPSPTVIYNLTNFARQTHFPTLTFSVPMIKTFFFFFWQRTNVPVPWLAILTSGSVWVLIISQFVNGWGLFVLIPNLPLYFGSGMGMSINQVTIHVDLV